MFKFSPRTSIFLLAAVIMLTAVSFLAPLRVQTVYAGVCQPGWWYGPERVVAHYTRCEWDFGCWINPWQPNGEWRDYDRVCKDKFDQYGYCGTDCWERRTGTGGCCNR